MKHNMSEPCQHCPFRKDIAGYLTRERVVEIAQSVMCGESFPCHKTTRPFEDEDGDCDMEATADSCQCAGAEIFAAHNGGSSQMSRISERLGLKVAKLKMDAPICTSVREMIAVHCGEEETGETCEIVGDDCTAPAGFSCGSGVMHGTEYVTTTCNFCGQYVCEACSKVFKRGKRKGERMCLECQEKED